MNNEDKILLFKDLCSRLPYGVKVQVYYEEMTGSGYFDETVWSVDNDEPFHVNDRWIENIKPYLRTISSMTEEEKKVVCSMNMISDIELNDRLNYQRMYVQNYTIDTFDYFNEHKLDYRGLIEKGLALEAPENMYNLN